MVAPPPETHLWCLFVVCVVICSTLIITAKQQPSSMFVITAKQEPSNITVNHNKSS